VLDAHRLNLHFNVSVMLVFLFSLNSINSRYVRLREGRSSYVCPLSLCVLYQPVSTLCNGRITATYSAPLQIHVLFFNL